MWFNKIQKIATAVRFFFVRMKFSALFAINQTPGEAKKVDEKHGGVMKKGEQDGLSKRHIRTTELKYK